ncbi:MAG: hypothetical protein KDA68_02825 [Planctomycetaceae bacterium]|nr:hypothetical protein [Planctomycetaceae bacterium]
MFPAEAGRQGLRSGLLFRRPSKLNTAQCGRLVGSRDQILSCDRELKRALIASLFMFYIDFNRLR